ncbi:MAG: polyphosphate polymerase domain-containing protein [Lachnospiraceae bacterium]|nr:polyphosphate polymerase domain-containing protein [Lachnospiraceae bacterium]
MAISVMKRYELKYLMDEGQADALRKELEKHMRIDEYGRTSIASLYYDTPDARLIRTALEKPAYKEKIRLRSYGLATEESPVFLELKRKYDGVVYKRRITSTIPDIRRFFEGKDIEGDNAQIQKELKYFRDYYGSLSPSCLIIYDRTAYFEPDGDLRLTIDHKPRYRINDLTLTKSLDGIPLLKEGWSILEVKVQGAMPLWLSSVLSEERIYKSSFSKYGEAYRLELEKKMENTLEFTVPALFGVA